MCTWKYVSVSCYHGKILLALGEFFSILYTSYLLIHWTVFTLRYCNTRINKWAHCQDFYSINKYSIVHTGLDCLCTCSSFYFYDRSALVTYNSNLFIYMEDALADTIIVSLVADWLLYTVFIIFIICSEVRFR